MVLRMYAFPPEVPPMLPFLAGQADAVRFMKGRTMDNTKIDRINALYHKSQSVGLTDEEKEEQAALRKEYIQTIRANLRGQLNNIPIKEPDGSITDLGKKYGGIKTV